MSKKIKIIFNFNIDFSDNFMMLKININDYTKNLPSINYIYKNHY
jgi:hypothetical protein